MQKKAWLPVKIISLLLVLLAFPRTTFAYYTNMPASVVVGQPDFISNSPGTSSTSLNNPSGIFVDEKGRLLVVEYSNNRVLIWNQVPTANGTPADLVIGQTDFDTGSINGGKPRDADTLRNPTAVWVYQDKLLVADAFNHRVLIWNEFPTTNGEPADVVVGNSTMTSQETTCDSKTINVAYGMAVYNGKLIVSSSGHDRVLIWNAIPTTDYAPADVVLGQPDFTTCDSVSASQHTIVNGLGVTVDKSGRLFVADPNAFRILLWNSIPTENYVPADVVIGQADFDADADLPAAPNTLGNIRVPFSNGNKLFVGDANHNRVLIFNVIPTTNGASADVVIGQSDFYGSLSNAGGTTSANTVSGAGRVFEYQEKLLVVDSGNSRILIFEDYEATATPGFTVNYPPESSGEKMRLSGNIVMGEYGRFDLRSPEVSINNQGFEPLTNFSRRQHSDHETIIEFYHEFEPWAGVAPKDQWSEGDGFTAHFRATSYQSKIETQEAFLFWPFTLDSVSMEAVTPVFSFHIPGKNIGHIKSDLDRFEVYIGKEGSFSKYLKRIPMSLVGEDGRVVVSADSEGVQTAQATFLPGEYEVKVRAYDKWGNHFDSNALPIPLTQALVSVESTPFTGFWFPLQINRATGINTGIVSSFRPESVKPSYASTTLTPTFTGIAFADSLITMTVVNNRKLEESKTFTTTTGPDSTWSLTPTLYPDSSVVLTSQTAGLSAQIPPFQVRLTNVQ